MDSKHEIKEGIYWINYVEDSTFEKAYDLIDTVTPLIDKKILQGVILDLRGVDMLNSSGIGLILEFFKDVSEKNLIFVVITNDYVQRTLELIGVEGMIETAESRGNALQLVQTKISMEKD